MFTIAGGSGRRRWRWGALTIAAAMVLPVLAIVYLAISPSDGIWSHLVSTVLGDYVTTTLSLMTLVGLGVFLIGTGTAWMITMHRFPGDRILDWALMLPLAVPAYVIAYVYTDVLEYAGPVQGLARDLFGWQSARDYWFPEIRSVGGAAIMMTLVLYPYVYLLARAAFTEQSVCALEVCRTLGKGPWATFRTVALPMARPAIVLGVALPCMEVLNDFGTVDFFAVRTLTAGLYDVWLNMNSTPGAAQIAVVMLVFVIGLLWLERWARRGQQYHNTTTKLRPLTPQRLTGGKAALASMLCALPVILGFVLPAWVLASNAVRYYSETVQANVLQYALNSLGLSAAAALIAVTLGLFLAYGARISGDKTTRALTRFASMGYAVPGAVLAVGVVIPLAAFDNAVDAWMRDTWGISTGLLLSGTAFAIVYGYVVRFLALAFGAMDASLTKVTPNMEGAARTLGCGPAKTLGRVHLPLIRASILAALVLVFVDAMKELPMTMLLRPFNFDTLATFVHQYASDELFEEASLGALLIVLVGTLPVVILTRQLTRARPADTPSA